jgi:hypothetical protein
MRTIPKTMRAAVIDRFGPLEVLTIHELPVPEIDPNEVLIELDTAGVGPWDADIREGWTPPGDWPRFPLVLGTDGAGTVGGWNFTDGGDEFPVGVNLDQALPAGFDIPAFNREMIGLFRWTRAKAWQTV